MTRVEPLTEQQMAILEFERATAEEMAARWRRYPGERDTAIRDWFGVTASVYFQRLNHILDLPAAEVYDPTTVRRLRRLRTARQVARASRQIGFDLAGGAR